MTEDNRVAHLEVASAYAPQKAGNGTNWCVGYEVTNNGPDGIPLFYWRVSGQKIMTFSELKAGVGPSDVVVTLKPGPDPILKDTVLNGFKSQSITTKVFQSAKASVKPPLITLVASNGPANEPSPSTTSANKTLVLEKGSRLPDVGGEFTGAGSDIGATSIVTREGDTYHFDIQLGINNSKSVSSVVAPLTLAFAKLGGDVLRSPSPLNAVLEDVKSIEIYLPDNKFDVHMDLPVTNVQNIYVVRQPISFTDSSKSRICFLSPTYSPVQIPEGFLSCP